MSLYGCRDKERRNKTRDGMKSSVSVFFAHGEERKMLLTQPGLRSASVGARRVPLAHSAPAQRAGKKFPLSDSEGRKYMTLNQLLYVVEVSKTKSINATAHTLFVSQSCVSTAIRELEDELGIIIFNRTNRGITVTKDGETFIHYANNIIQQCKLLEEKYLGGEEHKRHFSVVMHHSTFAAKAFAGVVKEFGLLDYEYSIYETKTKTVLEQVRSAKSELGILYISTFNQDYYEKIFKELDLIFESIAEYEVYAYIGENHPLAYRDEIDLSELEEYPCLIFDQDENSSFYFYEEIISAYEYKNVIRTSDRATTIDLLQELDGYAVGIGTANDEKSVNGIRAVKIRTDEKINVGYVIREGGCLSEMAEKFIELFAADVTSL